MRYLVIVHKNPITGEKELSFKNENDLEKGQTLEKIQKQIHQARQNKMDIMFNGKTITYLKFEGMSIVDEQNYNKMVDQVRIKELQYYLENYNSSKRFIEKYGEGETKRIKDLINN